MVDGAAAFKDEAGLIEGVQLLATLLIGAGRELTAERLVQAAQLAVPSSAAVSLTFVEGSRSPRTLAASTPDGFAVDNLQYKFGEGPCLEAITDNDLVHSLDLSADPRWPRFGPAAVAELGIRSGYAVRLFLAQDDAAGALNFFATQPDGFTELDLAIGALLAAHIAQALRTLRLVPLVEQLEAALETNRRIGVAMGILMARQQLSTEQAFSQLRVASQHLNRKLHDIADEVTYTGELPKRA
jgi:hypothetical protein